MSSLLSAQEDDADDAHLDAHGLLTPKTEAEDERGMVNDSTISSTTRRNIVTMIMFDKSIMSAELFPS
jgi:hypothetical protein